MTKEEIHLYVTYKSAEIQLYELQISTKQWYRQRILALEYQWLKENSKEPKQFRGTRVYTEKCRAITEKRQKRSPRTDHEITFIVPA